MDDTKVAFALKIKELSTQAAQLLASMNEVVEIWDDRLYGPGAANQITLADLTTRLDPYNPILEKIVARPDDLYAFVIAASQLDKFVEANGAAVAGPYSATFNKLRQDM